MHYISGTNSQKPWCLLQLSVVVNQGLRLFCLPLHFIKLNLGTIYSYLALHFSCTIIFILLFRNYLVLLQLILIFFTFILINPFNLYFVIFLVLLLYCALKVTHYAKYTFSWLFNINMCPVCPTCTFFPCSIYQKMCVPKGQSDLPVHVTSYGALFNIAPHPARWPSQRTEYLVNRLW